jgi:hypothetical protein
VDISAEDAAWCGASSMHQIDGLCRIDLANRSFAHQRGWSMLAQSQTWGALNAISPVRGDIISGHIQIATDRGEHRIRPRQGAGWVSAHLDHSLPDRFPVEQTVKIDHTEDICQWHVQGAAHFGRYRLRDITIQGLGGVQGRQQGCTA